MTPNSLVFKYRGFVGMICLGSVGLAVAFSFPLVEDGTFLDITGNALGWLCFMLYVTFRLWATLYIGGRKDKELQTQGPYSITRNPLYFGSFCFALSTAFFLKSFSLLMATLITAVIYSRWVIAFEEQVLEKAFGAAFHDYVQKVPRFLPRLSHYQAHSSVELELQAMKNEAKRIWIASLLPAFAGSLMQLRMADWWPHWFTLP